MMPLDYYRGDPRLPQVSLGTDDVSSQEHEITSIMSCN